jgi:hypothetical protein
MKRWAHRRHRVVLEKLVMANDPDQGAQGEAVQGEGDYEAARRYNQHTREHVKKMTPEELDAGDPGQSEQQAQAAREAGESHARAGEQDLRDAEVFRALERKQKT